MRQYIRIITIALCACLLVGCQDYVPQDHFVSIIIDRSEADSYKPDMDDVMTYLTDVKSTDAIALSLCYISNTQYPSKYSFVLGKSEVGWLSNEDKRRKNRRRFFKQFQDSLHYYNSQQKPLLRSDILRVVVRELDVASKLKSDVDILLFSDLKEHSSLFSVYHSYQKQQLLKNSAAATERVISSVELPKNLTGVTLRIIYEPSIEDAPVFTAMVSMYKKVIELRGGKVVVGRHTKIERL